MNQDKNLINNLHWLNKALKVSFADKPFAELVNEDLSEDIISEVKAIAKYIKENYNEELTCENCNGDCRSFECKNVPN